MSKNGFEKVAPKVEDNKKKNREWLGWRFWTSLFVLIMIGGGPFLYRKVTELKTEDSAVIADANSVISNKEVEGEIIDVDHLLISFVEAESHWASVLQYTSVHLFVQDDVETRKYILIYPYARSFIKGLYSKFSVRMIPKSGLSCQDFLNEFVKRKNILSLFSAPIEADGIIVEILE